MSAGYVFRARQIRDVKTQTLTGNAEQRRHLEGLDRPDADEQSDGRERRADQRQGDSADDGTPPDAARYRGLLERRVEVQKRSRHQQQEDEGHEMESLDRDHPAHAEHVESAGPEQRLQEAVQRPCARARQEDQAIV